VVSFHRLMSWSRTESAVAWYAASWDQRRGFARAHRVHVAGLPGKGRRDVTDDRVGDALCVFGVDVVGIEGGLPGGLIADGPFVLRSHDTALRGEVRSWQLSARARAAIRKQCCKSQLTCQRALVRGTLLARGVDRFTDLRDIDVV
jgi:hypothetical protein